MESLKMTSISVILGKILVLYLGSLYFVMSSFAVVRTINTSESKMEDIYLSMGRSTVLRFKGETPIKAVSGNQNYFNIEFVKATSDVTIQPLGKINSNLFIYTDTHSYGFLLKVGASQRYDDRVDIRWKKKTNTRLRAKKVLKPKTKKIANVSLGLKNLVTIKAKSLTYLEGSQVHLLDLEVTNLSSKKIKVLDLAIYPTRSNKKIASKKIVFETEFINPKETIKARLVLLNAGKRGFTLNLLYQKRFINKIISRWYL